MRKWLVWVILVGSLIGIVNGAILYTYKNYISSSVQVNITNGNQTNTSLPGFKENVTQLSFSINKGANATSTSNIKVFTVTNVSNNDRQLFIEANISPGLYLNVFNSDGKTQYSEGSTLLHNASIVIKVSVTASQLIISTSNYPFNICVSNDDST